MSEENIYTFENEQYRKTYWHTCSHILAQAVKRLWPEVKLAIGPSIDNGFYYDLDAPFAFTPDNLAEIEAEMRNIRFSTAAATKASAAPSPRRILRSARKSATAPSASPMHCGTSLLRSTWMSL